MDTLSGDSAKLSDKSFELPNWIPPIGSNVKVVSLEGEELFLGCINEIKGTNPFFVIVKDSNGRPIDIIATTVSGEPYCFISIKVKLTLVTIYTL